MRHLSLTPCLATAASGVLPHIPFTKVVHTKPERDVRSLSLEWELSPFFAHKRLSQPDRMVSYVLGDEGPGKRLGGRKPV